jgi:hypothetical protein
VALREPPRGILLVHGGVAAAVSWAETGVSPLAVVPEDGRWTAVLPVEPSTAVRPPYDDAVTMLLNRPVPHRLRPAAGVADAGAVGELADVLHDPAGDARAVTGDLLEVLKLPGGSFLDGSAVAADAFGASVIAPKPSAVRRYDKAVHDDVRWRDEMEDRHR